jgi:hypothetical protein
LYPSAIGHLLFLMINNNPNRQHSARVIFLCVLNELDDGAPGLLTPCYC